MADNRPTSKFGEESIKLANNIGVTLYQKWEIDALFIENKGLETKDRVVIWHYLSIDGGGSMEIDLGQVQKMLDWVKTKLYLNASASKASKRAIKRGQVYKCNFGCSIGSEMQKNRPAVIIQNDVGNIRSGNTIVVPITHDASTLPCVANIEPKSDSSGKVILDGYANASNMMCVSKARLGNLVCTLSRSDMKSIDEAIAKTVGLMKYYADLTQKLNDKLSYIDRIKRERNKAQDELSEIRDKLGLVEDESLIDYILEMKKTIDN